MTRIPKSLPKSFVWGEWVKWLFPVLGERQWVAEHALPPRLKYIVLNQIEKKQSSLKIREQNFGILLAVSLVIWPSTSTTL